MSRNGTTMNGRILVLCMLCTIFSVLSLPGGTPVKAHEIQNSSDGQAQEIEDLPFTAEGMILMDAKSGDILYAKNEEETFYPASITKIVTALIALEYEDPQDEVTTSKLARHAEGNRIYLAAGEETPLIDLVFGMMLNSGNDAAIAIAEHIGGSIEGFADLMNEKAKQLGAVDTHFVTPNGLHDDDHYTTPADMARIAQAALENPRFRQVVQTKEMPWFGEDWHSKLINTNQLLWEYDGMTGIKTGYTSKAGQTYVGSATRNNTELIVVLMKADTRDRLWEEAQALLDYGFANYETMKAAAEGDTVPVFFHGEEYLLEVADDVYVTVENGAQPEWTEHVQTMQLPPFHPTLQSGTKIGQLTLKQDEQLIGQAELVLKKNLSYALSGINISHIREKDIRQGSVFSWVKNYWYAPMLVLASLIVWRIRRTVRARRSRRYVMRRYSKWGRDHWPPA